MSSSEMLLISDGAARPPREEHCVFQAVLGGEYDGKQPEPKAVFPCLTLSR